MKYAFISDVHGNVEALNAVLKDIKDRGFTDLFFLGDAVGYGPDPDECVNILYDRCILMLAGNHDYAVLGLTDIEFFNPFAKAAIEWTIENMNRRSLSILRALSISEEIENRRFLLVHSTPKEPEKWHYLLTLWDAEINFHYFDNQICLLGHSHYPFIIERKPSGEMKAYKDKAIIKDNHRYIINVGSVGQPRDGDPRACYAVIDEIDILIHRVKYDIKKTQDKMRMHGLPYVLIERLSRGM